MFSPRIRVRKTTQNPAAVDSGTPDPWSPPICSKHRSGQLGQLEAMASRDRVYIYLAAEPTNRKNMKIEQTLLLLRSESPSGMCAKLRNVATSNSRDYPMRSLLLLLLVCTTYIWVLFFAHIPFVVNRAFNATPAERLQHSHDVGLSSTRTFLCKRSYSYFKNFSKSLLDFCLGLQQSHSE